MILLPHLQITNKKNAIHLIKHIKSSFENHDPTSLSIYLQNLHQELINNQATVPLIAEVVSALMAVISTVTKIDNLDYDALYWGEQNWHNLLCQQPLDIVFTTITTTLEEVLKLESGSTNNNYLGYYSQHVKSIIDEHFPNNLSISELSEAVHLSPNYLCRVFKKETGLTLTDYITQLRIDRAKQFLRHDRQLKTYEIGELVGYADPVYFTKLFKKVVGKTPKAYRLAKN